MGPYFIRTRGEEEEGGHPVGTPGDGSVQPAGLTEAGRPGDRSEVGQSQVTSGQVDADLMVGMASLVVGRGLCWGAGSLPRPCQLQCWVTSPRSVLLLCAHCGVWFRTELQ